jgi:uncharacterized protein with GYD domain
MKFLALVKVHDNTADKKAIYEELVNDKIEAELGWNLPEGVKILESGIPFGTYDLVVFYEAPDEETAHSYLSELDLYCTIDRHLTKPCVICDRNKAT